MHWDASFLPDDYIRKMKQDLKELEDHVESKTRYEPVVRSRSGTHRATSESYYEPFPDDSPPPPDDD